MIKRKFLKELTGKIFENLIETSPVSSFKNFLLIIFIPKGNQIGTKHTIENRY
jgi:hypothetical protein